MVDSVQRNSSIPVQPFHTEQGVHNPLPLNAPKELNRVDDAVKQADSDKQDDGFEDYLNQSSITTLEKNQASNRFDPVSEIVAGSVYTQPDDKTQF